MCSPFVISAWVMGVEPITVGSLTLVLAVLFQSVQTEFLQKWFISDFHTFFLFHNPITIYILDAPSAEKQEMLNLLGPLRPVSPNHSIDDGRSSSLTCKLFSCSVILPCYSRLNDRASFHDKVVVCHLPHSKLVHLLRTLFEESSALVVGSNLNRNPQGCPTNLGELVTLLLLCQCWEAFSQGAAQGSTYQI